MSYRQYTSCYQHTPGDVPFKKADLITFVAGAAGLPPRQPWSRSH